MKRRDILKGGLGAAAASLATVAGLKATAPQAPAQGTPSNILGDPFDLDVGPCWQYVARVWNPLNNRWCVKEVFVRDTSDIDKGVLEEFFVRQTDAMLGVMINAADPDFSTKMCAEVIGRMAVIWLPVDDDLKPVRGSIFMCHDQRLFRVKETDVAYRAQSLN